AGTSSRKPWQHNVAPLLASPISPGSISCWQRFWTKWGASLKHKKRVIEWRIYRRWQPRSGSRPIKFNLARVAASATLSGDAAANLSRPTDQTRPTARQDLRRDRVWLARSCPRLESPRQWVRSRSWITSRQRIACGGAGVQTYYAGDLGSGSAKRQCVSRAAGHKDAKDFCETNRAGFTTWTDASLCSRVYRRLSDCRPSAQCGRGHGSAKRIRANGAARV